MKTYKSLVNQVQQSVAIMPDDIITPEQRIKALLCSYRSIEIALPDFIWLVYDRMKKEFLLKYNISETQFASELFIYGLFAGIPTPERLTVSLLHFLNKK